MTKLSLNTIITQFQSHEKFKIHPPGNRSAHGGENIARKFLSHAGNESGGLGQTAIPADLACGAEHGGYGERRHGKIANCQRVSVTCYQSELNANVHEVADAMLFSAKRETLVKRLCHSSELNPKSPTRCRNFSPCRSGGSREVYDLRLVDFANRRCFPNQIASLHVLHG